MCLVRDRFILALGGKISDLDSTESCEVFDSVNNEWFPMARLPFAIINSTAVVMNQRFVYLMPGPNFKCAVGDACLLHTIDTGSDIEFSAGRTSTMPFKEIFAQARWKQLKVKDKTFVDSMPSAGIQTSFNQILIFGGKNSTSFKLDINQTNPPDDY